MYAENHKAEEMNKLLHCFFLLMIQPMFIIVVLLRRIGWPISLIADIGCLPFAFMFSQYLDTGRCINFL